MLIKFYKCVNLFLANFELREGWLQVMATNEIHSNILQNAFTDKLVKKGPQKRLVLVIVIKKYLL